MKRLFILLSAIVFCGYGCSIQELVVAEETQLVVAATSVDEALLLDVGVVEFDSATNTIYYQQEKYANYGLAANGNVIAFSGSNVITGSNSNGVGTASTYANPELQPDSGKVIYIENRRPISRASDQTEDIKIVVEF